MIETKLFSGTYYIDDAINQFIKKETENNFSFRVIDIKYSAFGTGTNNYSTTHNALVIYEKITKEERSKDIDIVAKALLRYKVCRTCGVNSNEHPDLKFYISPYHEGVPGCHICENCYNKEATDDES